MARLTITEAIKASPVGRTRMYSHYIKKGLLTVDVDSLGAKYIDSSEIIRVFGTIKEPEQSGTPAAHTEQPLETATLNATEQPLETITAAPEQESELVKSLRMQLEEAKRDKEWLKKQNENLLLRLEPPKRRPNPFVRWWHGLGDKDEN